MYQMYDDMEQQPIVTSKKKFDKRLLLIPLIIILVVVIVVPVVLSNNDNNDNDNFCVPGMKCFPSDKVLSQFNKTINGRLYAERPAGSVCYRGKNKKK